jgi:hypothetical protein
MTHHECRTHAAEIHHHQPIKVATAGARAFLMDYPQGERTIIHHVGPVRIDEWVGRNSVYVIIYWTVNKKMYYQYTVVSYICKLIVNTILNYRHEMR